MTSLGMLGLFFFLILTPGAVLGGSGTPVSETQLQEKLRFYSTIRVLEADFHEVKDLKELGMQMKSEGRLTLKRPDRVIWEITKPARVRVELDPKGIRIVNGEGPTATVQTFSAEQMPKDKDTSSLHELIAWLKLDAHALASEYTITSTSANHFTFAPKKPGPFIAMEMDLSRAGHLEKLLLRETSGDSMTLQFAKPRVLKLLQKEDRTP